jgi:hypothetical protein
MAAVLPSMRGNPQLAEVLSELERGGVSAPALMTINAVVTGAVGLSFVVVGVLSRRGTPGPVITALVLACVVLLVQLVGTVAAAAIGQFAAAACNVIILIPLAILVVMLGKAARNALTVAAIERQYAAPTSYFPAPHGWPPQQQHPGHGTPSYGYGYRYGYGYGQPPADDREQSLQSSQSPPPKSQSSPPAPTAPRD